MAMDKRRTKRKTNIIDEEKERYIYDHMDVCTIRELAEYLQISRSAVGARVKKYKDERQKKTLDDRRRQIKMDDTDKDTYNRLSEMRDVLQENMLAADTPPTAIPRITAEYRAVLADMCEILDKYKEREEEKSELGLLVSDLVNG